MATYSFHSYFMIVMIVMTVRYFFKKIKLFI